MHVSTADCIALTSALTLSIDYRWARGIFRVRQNSASDPIFYFLEPEIVAQYNRQL